MLRTFQLFSDLLGSYPLSNGVQKLGRIGPESLLLFLMKAVRIKIFETNNGGKTFDQKQMRKAKLI
jgi:hypothetical protein